MPAPDGSATVPVTRAGSIVPAVRRRITARTAGSPEERLHGRYRLLEQLGHGGFGVVWRAEDELLHREVALKRVWVGSENDSERAAREALAAARLSHPAIVALHEAFASDGAYYLISELVDGETLAQLIAEDALEDEEVLEIGLALTSALAHAHARGVIHRDIKPQNVLVPNAPDERQALAPALSAAAKLTDFGGASLVGEEVLTRTGDVLGTLAYMAPEQSEGREVTAQADLYSLSLVLYEALTGVNPVRAATPAATARRIGRRLPPLARARPELPRALTAPLDRGLAPHPSERGSVEDLHDALGQALGGAHAGVRLPAHESTRRASVHPLRTADPHRRAVIAPRLPDGALVGGSPVGAPQTVEQRAHLSDADSPRARTASLARGAWVTALLALVLWQCAAGRPGLAVLAAAALVVPLALASVPGVGAGVKCLAALLAPVLGALGLASAFPALAGQASRWRERAVLGALGFWWLCLAEPLLGRTLWLGPPAHMPARAEWEASLTLAATHVLAPLLTLGALLGALLWAAAAMVLPWIVRGHSALRDVFAAIAWAALLLIGTPAVDAGLKAHGPQPQPRGLLTGALLAALLAVAARAVRGPS